MGTRKSAAKPAATKSDAAKAVTPEDLSQIEQQVFAIAGMNEIAEPAIFRGYVERVAEVLTLKGVSRKILEAFSNVDVSSDKLGQCVTENPYYEFQFIKMIESLGRKDVGSMSSAVVLLGMQNSRNLIIAMQILRTVKGVHPEWSKEGKLSFDPKTIVKYALKTEELLSGNKSGYADTAYAAGVMFDLLSTLAEEVGGDPKKIQAYIDTVYAHGLKSAKVAMELIRFFPDFGFKKYLFASCLVHDIGKVILALLDSSYVTFLEDCEKKTLPRQVRHFAEQKRHGVDHAILGGMACRNFQIFEPIARAVQYHHEPYLLKAENKNLYLLSQIMCLATNMASNLKKAEKPDDPVIALWKSPEVKDLKIEAKHLMEAVQKVITAG